MRNLDPIEHPLCKISVFSWNGKFLIKFEQGLCEQTYKVEHLEVRDEAALRSMVNEDFIGRVLKRFEEMHEHRLALTS
jgi:hypothetical protein